MHDAWAQHTEKCAAVCRVLVGRLLIGNQGKGVSDLSVPVYILLTNLPKVLCIFAAIRLAEAISSEGVISGQRS